MNADEFEKVLMTETQKRIDIMKSPEYEFPVQGSKIDWILIGVSIVASAILALLSAVGVIA